ncbi:Sodium- and chloride-dependent GABA transporter 1 [Marasmius crinis-equi]|uniref:Sodium- and chloride-dependent GABA transporter 1 n=1 Tax=Marasmius crinis-equi TaxID=585013 RepID=A0ABR3G0H6_9AGAR
MNNKDQWPQRPERPEQWDNLFAAPLSPNVFAALAASGVFGPPPDVDQPSGHSAWSSNSPIYSPSVTTGNNVSHHPTPPIQLPPSLWMSPHNPPEHSSSYLHSPVVSPTSPKSSIFTDIFSEDLFSSKPSQSNSPFTSPRLSGSPDLLPSQLPVLEEEDPQQLAKQDPLATQVWKMYARTKANLPHAQRMENLTWRMMALALKKKKEDEIQQQQQQQQQNDNQQPQDFQDHQSKPVSAVSSTSAASAAAAPPPAQQQPSSSSVSTSEANHSESDERGRRIDKGKGRTVRVVGFDGTNQDKFDQPEDVPMDWRALSRSRSRISMDWTPTTRSRSRPPETRYDPMIFSDFHFPGPASAPGAPFPMSSTSPAPHPLYKVATTTPSGKTMSSHGPSLLSVSRSVNDPSTSTSNANLSSSHPSSVFDNQTSSSSSRISTWAFPSHPMSSTSAATSTFNSPAFAPASLPSIGLHGLPRPPSNQNPNNPMGDYGEHLYFESPHPSPHPLSHYNHSHHHSSTAHQHHGSLHSHSHHQNQHQLPPELRTFPRHVRKTSFDHTVSKESLLSALSGRHQVNGRPLPPKDQHQQRSEPAGAQGLLGKRRAEAPHAESMLRADPVLLSPNPGSMGPPSESASGHSSAVASPTTSYISTSFPSSSFNFSFPSSASTVGGFDGLFERDPSTSSTLLPTNNSSGGLSPAAASASAVMAEGYARLASLGNAEDDYSSLMGLMYHHPSTGTSTATTTPGSFYVDPTQVSSAPPDGVGSDVFSGEGYAAFHASPGSDGWGTAAGGGVLGSSTQASPQTSSHSNASTPPSSATEAVNVGVGGSSNGRGGGGAGRKYIPLKASSSQQGQDGKANVQRRKSTSAATAATGGHADLRSSASTPDPPEKGGGDRDGKDGDGDGNGGITLWTQKDNLCVTRVVYFISLGLLMGVIELLIWRRLTDPVTALQQKLHGVVRPLSLKTDVIKKRNRASGTSNSSSRKSANSSNSTSASSTLPKIATRPRSQSNVAATSGDSLLSSPTNGGGLKRQRRTSQSNR